MLSNSEMSTLMVEADFRMSEMLPDILLPSEMPFVWFAALLGAMSIVVTARSGCALDEDRALPPSDMGTLPA